MHGAAPSKLLSTACALLLWFGADQQFLLAAQLVDVVLGNHPARSR